MKRKITFLSAALMLLAFLAVPQGMRGQTTETFTFSELGYSNAADVTTVEGTNVTLTFAKGTNSSNAPKYYTTGTAVRMYTGNTLEVALNDQEGESRITAIDFTFSGTYTGSLQDWAGSETSVSFTNTASGQARIQVIAVTYTEGGTPAVTHTLTFSANPTDGGTVSVGNTTLAEGATTSISATANAGYVFGSWTVTGEGSSVNDAGDTFTMGTEDATLTANFTAVTTYTVTYHANVTGIDDIEVVYNAGNDVTVAENTFSNPGFAFSEWNTQADGDGDPYVAGDVIENIQADIDLYAQWEESSEATATLNIQSYASDHSWVNGTQYSSVTVDQVTFTASEGNNTGKYYTADNTWRYYQGESATITISVPNGYHLVSIKPTYNPYNGGALLNGSATIQSGSTVGVSGTSVTFSVGNSGSATNGQVRFTNIDVTYASDGGVTYPSISAENVSVEYNATSGNITYTINNPVDGGTLTAATTSEWLTLGTVGETVPFTCTANEAAIERTATVTLTYTYDSQTVTKDVTVTQAGNPNYTMTIAEVRAQGTGSVVTRGIVTSCSGVTAYIQDTTAAICVYGEELTVGDEIRVSGTLDDYNGLLEIKNPTVTVLSSGNTIEPQLMTVAEAVASTNQGWYIRFEEVTVTSISGQNTTVAQGDASIVVRGISGVTYQENDVLSLNGNIGHYNSNNQIANPQNVEVQAAPAVPSITVNPATVSVDAEEAEGALDITYENLTITEAGDFDIQYYNAQGEEIEELDWISAEVNKKLLSKNDTTYTYYEVTYVIAANNGEARTAYFKVYALDANAELVYSNLVTINQAAYVAPVASITFDPDFLNVDAGFHYGEDFLPFTYENILVENAQSFGLQFYTADGEEIEMPTNWFMAMVTPQDGSDAYQVTVGTRPNDGEARSAYFKVYAYDADSTLVYSNLATVNQAAPVYDYAVLPFVWEGGSSTDFAALNGVTLSGNGSDYNNNHTPYLIKFDSDGDYIMVKTNSQPGTVTIGVKMIGGGNTSMITVQGSADGETFTDIEELTISGAQNDILTLETTNVFGDNDRYVKLLFTKGSNVGVGPITITNGMTPSITLTPDTFDLDAVGPQSLNGMQVPSSRLSYHNIEITEATDFTVQFYNAEGEEQERPEWVRATAISPLTDDSTSYQVVSLVLANDGPARSAYFRVYAYDADSIAVYSNLVTYNQAGALQQYTLTVEPFENLELITFVNDEMVMEADGEIQVNEGDHIMLSIVADEGYDMETLMVNGVNHVNDIADDFTYEFDMPAEAVTISATAIEHVVPTPGEWVMTSLNDLTENDVFVIVGVYDVDESSFAMPNNSTGAPSAVDVTMVGNTLSGDIDDNLKWNLSIGEDGYTFYPDGDTTTWLYCNNTNNGVRMGTNENNVFSMTSEGYLYNNATDRYIGIYNHQDWRCYTSINNNIKNQTFAFFKRVDESEIETYTLDITGYGDNEGGYYLIAPPVSMIRPTAENGFLTDEYDLYYFDQAQQGEEWRNYKAKKFFPASGKGYLYASQESTMLIFTGVPYNGNGEVALDYTEGASFAGWNLIGNPFGNAATIDKAYYRLNADGSEVNATTESSAIAAMEGVFVVAETVGETVTFTEQTNPNNNNEVSQISINVSMNRGESIDRAIVRFDNGNQLPKFQLNPNHTKVYFPQGENDYAIVRSANEGEMPVNFKAENNGTYTISINTENVEMDYLHLIDNMTGADVDLLANPSYSFEAKTTDYANRFRLVFNANTVNENGNETFAYFNGSEWVISNMGEATLQVVDMMGRVLSTETVNGNATMNLNQTPGVYMLRLVNGDSMKVQKVVVR